VCEGVLPHGRAEDVQEERRICYVAVTRAIDRLYVSYFLERFKKELAPSRFINEMLLEQRVGRPLLGELEVAA
jgi:DNA helicase-2/ATP-dependent DNA helicase PcrA